MRRRLFLISATASVALAWCAHASEQTGTEMLFETGALDSVEAGTVLHYAHERMADENIPFRTIENGAIQVAIVEDGDASRSEVTMINGPQRRKLHHFPVDRGNPIFVTFLESSVSSVTYATKGSPFYIRNRLKDAFAQGGDVTEIEAQIGGDAAPATQIRYTPFKGDRNAAKMGQAFEALTVTFVLSESVPGRFVSLTTESRVGEEQFFMEKVEFLDAKPE